MSPMLDKTLRLTLICGVAALLLGVVNSITEPQIEIRREQRIQEALSALLESGNIGPAQETTIEDVPLYYNVSDQGTESAYILSLVGKGYGGEMKILAAYDLNGTLLNAQLMDNAETPGLGKNAEKPSYMEKFIGSGSDQPIPVRKDQLGEAADEITGATITFSGVSNALARGSEFIKNEEWNK